MDKKRSFILYPAEYLAAVHNFRKSEIADLIVSLCQFNLYGSVSIKISDVVQEKMTSLQEAINENNARYAETCEKRRRSGSKGGKQKVANAKQTESAQINFAIQNEAGYESDSGKGKDNDNVFINKKDKERKNGDNFGSINGPTVEEVAEYSKESGYTIDPIAFVNWHEERGWKHGKKCVALDWRKAVRKWYCKENGLSLPEMETMADLAGDILSKVKGGKDGTDYS